MKERPQLPERRQAIFFGSGARRISDRMKVGCFKARTLIQNFSSSRGTPSSTSWGSRMLSGSSSAPVSKRIDGLWLLPWTKSNRMLKEAEKVSTTVSQRSKFNMAVRGRDCWQVSTSLCHRFHMAPVHSWCSGARPREESFGKNRSE